MPASEHPQDLLTKNLDWFDRVCAALSRRNRLDEADRDDFASWAKCRILEDDCEILRKYRGESAVTTYLTVVLVNLMREYRASMWGRWRPSVAARRAGQKAVRLETLVHRDGYALAQAAEILRGEGFDASDVELARLLAALPARAPLRPVPVGPEPIRRMSCDLSADARLEAAEVEATRQLARSALLRGIDQLPAEDALILRLKFWQGLSVADVARELGIPQKPLYRRIERLLGVLRGTLEAGGVTVDVVGEIVEAA